MTLILMYHIRCANDGSRTSAIYTYYGFLIILHCDVSQMNLIIMIRTKIGKKAF